MNNLDHSKARFVAIADEVELDRLVTALPAKYGHLSEHIAIEKIERAFPDDEVRRLAALDHLRKIRMLRGGVVRPATPRNNDQRRKTHE